ncbi:MAG TPA: hypothetical protein VND99_00040 [Candidatus Acidoferrales bacterium]|nr:hypothetical protein [Candidatus Acidoferrales bacterium]
MKPIKPLYVLILVIVVGAGAFYGGTLYQKTQLRAGFASSAGGQFYRSFNGQGGQRTFGGPGGAQGMTPVRGQIISTGSDSVTVKLTDGSSKIVNLTSQTKINKATSGSVSDLKSGITVTAIGTTNSDGSVTALDVTIGNGAFMMRGGRTGGQSAPTGQ